MTRLLITGVLLLSFTVKSPAAGLLQGLAEKRRDSVKEFDLSADPASLTKTFVDGKKLSALKGLKRVVIPSFQVEFAVANSASAMASGASVKSAVQLVGIDNATFQKITDDIYDKVVADLTAAGLEVLPYEKVKDNEHYLKFKSRLKETAEAMRTQDGKSLYFSPHGMPLYFRSNDQRFAGLSVFANSMTMIAPQNYEPGIAKDLDAAVLRVRLIVDIAKQSSSGNHVVVGTYASVKTKAALNIMSQFTEYMFITPHNGTAELVLAKNINSAEQVLELKKARDTSLDLSALGGSNSGKVEYVLITEPVSYSRAVTAHLNATHALFMSVVKENL